MMDRLVFSIASQKRFQQQALFYFSNKRNVVFLNSNNHQENFIAISDNDEVTDKDWQFGFVTYDYKNTIEKLSSNHFDGVLFPQKLLFTPELLFIVRSNEITILYDELIYTEKIIVQLIKKIEAVVITSEEQQKIKIQAKISKDNYLKNVNQLKKHIQLGDIYEVNYCQEFYAQDVDFDPLDTYIKLNEISPTPYSCFVKNEERYLISASPEGFMERKGDQIFSRPIKGTIRRSIDIEEDKLLKVQLLNDQKERSENVMIVDIVRNDLSRIAQKGTVNVDELCQVYTFPQVHQMISTISAKAKKDVQFDDIVTALFPMGSMTGAPKIRAMELIEQYEETKRGLYSGTVGFIRPEGDFNFNVVIRSILYNKKEKYLSFMVGGAITSLSDPEKEYEECLLKAKAILEVLNNSSDDFRLFEKNKKVADVR